MPDFDLVLSAINRLATSTPPVLLFFGLLALGYVCKIIPPFPNKRIPMVNLIAAMILYPIISQSHLEDTYGYRFPWVGALVRDEIVALCVFALAWAFHAVALKRIEQLFFKKEDSALTTPDDPANLTH